MQFFFATDSDLLRRVRECLSWAPIFIILVSCGEKSEPNVAPAEVIQATNYESLLAGFEEELADAQEAVGADPNDGARLHAAQIRTNVGLCLDALDRRDEALLQLAEAAEELRALPDTLAGKADTLGACADGLGLAYHGAGKHGLARDSFIEAIEHRTAAMNGMATVSKIHLGNLYVSMSQYSQARSLLDEAVKEAVDPDVVIASHNALGRYFHTIGSYAEGLDHYGKAETAALKLWGENSGEVAGVRSNQASTLFRSGRLNEARERYVAVLNYYETLGDHEGAATVMNNLANVDLQQGELESAAALFDLATEARENDDPEILTSLAGSGYLHLWNGNMIEAESDFNQAEKLGLELLGEDHQLTIEIRQGLGDIALATGNGKEAAKRANQIFSSARNLMLEALKSGSEEQHIAYRDKIDLMSLTCALGDPELIADRLAQSQGLILDSNLDESARLATPKGTASVAYVRFVEYEPSGIWTAQYGAVISQTGKPRQWCRLATEKQLNGLIDALFSQMAFEQAMDDGKKPPAPLRKLEPTLRRIHDLVWKPIADRLDSDIGDVAVCPDGMVSAIPFAALLDGERFLCESPLQLSFFTRVRDVAAKAKQRKLGHSLAYGVSSFGGSQADRVPEGGAPPYSRSLIAALQKMGDLPGVEREIDALRTVFAKAGEKLEIQVNSPDEGTLRKIVGASKILHFASHAFVLPEEPGKLVGKRPSLDRSSSLERTGLVVGPVDPLLDGLRKGSPLDQTQDNILFTKEIAALELADTWLVTLSACSTGRGEQVSGEGVIGLQRGFFAAGVQHIAMTLWPISDAYAPEFVSRFYGNVFATDRPDAAMWEAQRNELVRLRNSEERLGTAVWLAGPWIVSSQGRSW